MTDIIMRGSTRNLQNITKHVCSGCLNNAQVAASVFYGDVNNVEVNDGDAYTALAQDVAKFLSDRGHRYMAETGLDPNVVAGHVFMAMHAANVDMFDVVNHDKHPLGRLVFLGGLYRTALLDSIAATTIAAADAGHGDAMAQAAECGSAMDNPLETVKIMDIVSETRDRYVADAVPEPKVTMLSDNAGMIDFDEDTTPEAAAAIVRATIIEQGGPDLPLDQIVAAIKSGVGVIKVPK